MSKILLMWKIHLCQKTLPCLTAIKYSTNENNSIAKKKGFVGVNTSRSSAFSSLTIRVGNSASSHPSNGWVG